jgi:hypothetical protein
MKLGQVLSMNRGPVALRLASPPTILSLLTSEDGSSLKLLSSVTRNPRHIAVHGRRDDARTVVQARALPAQGCFAENEFGRFSQAMHL